MSALPLQEAPDTASIAYLLRVRWDADAGGSEAVKEVFGNTKRLRNRFKLFMLRDRSMGSRE